MTNFKPGDRVQRRPDAPNIGTDLSGVWTVSAVWPGLHGPILRIRQGSRCTVVGARHYISEQHAGIIAAHTESVRRVGKERVARLARLWRAER